MISVINPSQYGAFSRPSGVVHYPDFYSYHMTTSSTRTTSTENQQKFDPTSSRTSSASNACQFANTGSSVPANSNNRNYFSNGTSGSSSGSTTRLSSSPSSSTSGCVQTTPAPPPRGLVQPTPGKDYSKPLFVDCSIEYELPNAPKIPKNSSPILMIPPTYQKKLIAQQQQQQQQIQQRSSPCSGPQCRQCQEASLMRKKLKDNVEVERLIVAAAAESRKATKRTYAETTENIYKHSIQGNFILY